MRGSARQPFHEPIPGPVLPGDWGFEMTLCIGAIAPMSNAIVVAVDTMISTADAADSMEASGLKLKSISRRFNWWTMFAGDPSTWRDIFDHAEARISADGERHDIVVKAFEDAFQYALRRKIEAEILAPYDLTLERFMKRGKRMFGAHEFTELLTRIDHASLKTEALVAGFDSAYTPHLFSVCERSTAQHHEHLGFHAIGTGSYLALAALYGSQGQVQDLLDLSETIYRVCDAKFLGERALGVGQKTVLLVIEHEMLPMALFPAQLEPVKDAWRARNKLPAPREAKEAIAKQVEQVKAIRERTKNAQEQK